MTGSAKQSRLSPRKDSGLLRRFAPRNAEWKSSRTNRLDIIAVRIDQERRVIGRAVILARTGAAIVAAAALQSFAVERLDRVVIAGTKCDVGAVGLAPLVQMQPERRFALRPEPGIAVAARAQDVAERRQNRGVEARGGVEVADAQSDV